jgi:hypothetical protein
MNAPSEDSLVLNQTDLQERSHSPFKHSKATPMFYFSPKAPRGQLSLKNKLRSSSNRSPVSPSPVSREDNYSQLKATRRLMETSYEKVLMSITPTLRSYHTRTGLNVGSFRVPGLNQDIPPFAHQLKERHVSRADRLPKIGVSGQAMESNIRAN